MGLRSIVLNRLFAYTFSHLRRSKLHRRCIVFTYCYSWFCRSKQTWIFKLSHNLIISISNFKRIGIVHMNLHATCLPLFKFQEVPYLGCFRISFSNIIEINNISTNIELWNTDKLSTIGYWMDLKILNIQSSITRSVGLFN